MRLSSLWAARACLPERSAARRTCFRLISSKRAARHDSRRLGAGAQALVVEKLRVESGARGRQVFAGWLLTKRAARRVPQAFFLCDSPPAPDATGWLLRGAPCRRSGFRAERNRTRQCAMSMRVVGRTRRAECEVRTVGGSPLPQPSPKGEGTGSARGCAGAGQPY